MSLLSANCWAKIAEGIAKATQAAVVRKSEEKLSISGCPFCTAEARSRVIHEPAIFSRIAFIGITSRQLQLICCHLRVMYVNLRMEAGVGEPYPALALEVIPDMTLVLRKSL